MDIFEIIKSNLPDGVEISDKAIKSIAKDISTEQGKEFVPKESYAKKTDRIIELETELSDLKGAVADSEGYKTKYEDEVAAHGRTKSEYEEKETLSQKRSLAKKTLLDSGVKEDILEDFMLSTLDYDAISLKDGAIKDSDKFIEAQKERYGKYFGKVSEEGAHVDTPPAGGGKTNYKEQLETARKSGDTAAAVRIKTEAAKENIFLI